MTHQQSRSNSRMSRSPSKSRSRSSEKILEDNGSRDRLSAPKFRMVTKSPSPGNRRRASAIQFSDSPSGTRTNHARSRSLRAKRHSAHIPHSLSGSQLDTKASLNQRSSISHSLSVPSGDEGDFHLVRNFSITSKGVVNRGDSFRCKSRSASLSSTPTSPGSEKENAFPAFTTDEAASASASPVTTPVPSASSTVPETKEPPKYSVWILGMNGVGKTSIRNQFMTSEYICQYETWKDESVHKSVVVSLDGEETELEISEYISVEDKIKNKESLPDAFLIVYSVTNRRSYILARQILSKLETTFGSKAAILVGNKTDLARLRTVTTVEGRSLAKERGCKFVETSVAINHQLDELLVGIITQIRIKAKIAEKQRKRSDRSSQTSRNKATCIIKRIWRRTCMTSKSCDNLHAL
ncbi:GTP-binding protein REM 1-like [Parasteatoda tepidariorum]|uniref:GTP-binding protein REM 1-like n=1 Tax=Parasteatoda tepidariorum TaxID=114398 RepID=UPI001C728BBA|nr:GTP-binding protein REM 1-like [Parasteatoda tepidariorum]